MGSFACPEAAPVRRQRVTSHGPINTVQLADVAVESDPRTGFPLNCRTPPLLGASGHYTVHHAQTHRHLLSPRSRSSTFRPPGAPVLPDSLSCSLAERHTTAGVVFSLVVGVASSAAAFRLRQPLPAPPVLRVSTTRSGSPRARTVALGRAQFHPQEVEPALPGQRVVPAPAASL